MKSTETLAELEEILGPPEHFIPNGKNSQYLAKWALAIGVPPVQVYGSSTVQLANLYHERGNKIKSDASELERLCADIFLRLCETIQSSKIDPHFMRELIREEIANQRPQKIEIINGPSHTVLDGPQHYMTETVLRVCALNHPIMLVGPAGCGKTTIGNMVARALQLPFYITNNVSDTFEVIGFVDGRGEYHRQAFREAFENGGVWIADEIDAWDAGALLTMNSALANGYCVFPDSPKPVYRHPDFRMIATANTYGHGADRVYVGRNQLDAASLDRFGMITIDYDTELERLFCNGNSEWLVYVWKIRKAVDKARIRHVVSSRAIIMGSAALAAGLPRKDVEEIYLFKGMKSSDREKIEDELV